ncbi:ComEC/Rec2 family competence protein [Microbacterium sp. BK668]|uniref:ComEC/Rec2 family competence protein n=1 Tax=Microbacterium sp. BK668 TaxID=2512118 RepID=UPI0010E861EF|nr:ComEC/Rec2 family competence protein [Microbacterium sp. BK668]TDN92814.1 competence protein ComEC [Microbacterium sp. BK668]
MTVSPAARRRLRRLRLLAVAGWAWSVAIVATLAPAMAGFLALAGWAITAGTVALIPRRHGTALVALVLALAAGSAVASHVALAEPARDDLRSVVGGGRAIEVTATVVGKVEQRASRELAFDAVVTIVRAGRADVPGHDLPIGIRVHPEEVEGLAELDVGAIVVAAGSTRATDAGERAVVDLLAGRGVAVVQPPVGLLAAAGALRHGLTAAAEGLPEPGGGLLPGLAVGDTTLVEPSLDEAMTSSSLSHLTAVSGANCALVVGTAFAAAALAGASRGVRIAASMAALGGFVVLVTPEPSVSRAAVMAAVAMLAVALGRPAVGISVLSLAVTVLLIGDPWLATSLGFALSAVATASLLLLARPLASGLERWMPRSLALGLSVPIAAQLACGPLLVLIDPTVPLYGVVANLLAAPAAPAATVVGLAACLALSIPVLQSGLAAIAWVPSAWIAATAHTFADVPGGALPWLEGWPGALALAGLGAVGAVLTLRRVPPALRTVSALLAAAVVGVLTGSSALGTVAGPLTLPANWTILACDVGQGDAVLIRSAGEVALIDTGPEPEALSGCLDRAGVGRLDLLVLTHFDLDHAGGSAAVIGRVAHVRHGPPTSAADEALLRDFDSAGASVAPAVAGEHGGLGAAQWRIRWPPAGSRAFPGGNDASVVVDIAGGGVPHALFLGDLSASPQRGLAASGTLRPPYEVVKVAHHGSADQAPELYERIDPAVALVTVGSDNGYGHPRRETLDLLADLGAVLARTDDQGMLALWHESSGAVAVWRERGDVSTAD